MVKTLYVEETIFYSTDIGKSFDRDSRIFTSLNRPAGRLENAG
jgi:hypothetical protein